MQADGTMATNKWIQWYNKWYYVGSDGRCMLTVTPGWILGQRFQVCG